MSEWCEAMVRDVALRGFRLRRWIAEALPGEPAHVFGAVARTRAKGRLRVAG